MRQQLDARELRERPRNPMEMADASVLETVEQELLTPAVVVAAIADLVARAEEPIKGAKVRHDQLQTAPMPPSASLDHEVLKHLEEWRGLLGQNTSRARQLLRKVLDGRVAFSRGDANDRWYEMAGRATLEKFLASVPAIKTLVAVRGFEPRSRG